MSIVLVGSTSGSCTLQEQAVAGTTVLTLPTTSGTLLTTATPFSNGQGPAFRVYLDSNQTVTSAVSTKVTLNSELFDTASCFNNTGSTVGGIPAYAFLPNVAGYYQFNVTGGASASSGLSYNYIRLFKNGAADSIAIYGPYLGASNYGALATLIYLNGTTDYVELYAQIEGVGTVQVTGGNTAVSTYMSGYLARAA